MSASFRAKADTAARLADASRPSESTTIWATRPVSKARSLTRPSVPMLGTATARLAASIRLSWSLAGTTLVNRRYLRSRGEKRSVWVSSISALPRNR